MDKWVNSENNYTTQYKTTNQFVKSDELCNSIKLRNITYQYEKGRNIFDDFSLEIDCGQITVMVGKNGSGKTTAAKLMMGILKPKTGTIDIFGCDIKTMTLGQVGSQIGYVFQNPERQLFATSVMEELTFASVMRGNSPQYAYEQAEKMIKLFQLENVRDSYPFLLSYGEKKRLAIAAILVNKPEYLILDEPTSSLDSERIEILSKVIDELRQSGMGLLIISHDKGFIKRHGDRIITIEEGKTVNDEQL